MKYKIAFLYLDNTYCIYHSLPIAIEMAKNNDYQIEIFASLRNKRIIDNLMACQKSISITINLVRGPWHYQLPTILEIKLQFRAYVFRKYKNTLSTFNLVVTTIYNDILLKKYLSKSSITKILFTAHGIANSTYAFNNVINKFDYFFIKGKKEEKIRNTLGQLQKNNFAKIGYVKLDIIKMKKINIFPNSNKTYWYNPHWNSELSSFELISSKILDFFCKNNQLNLIFAPHSYLSKKHIFIERHFSKYHSYSNIHLDFGSEALADMTYAVNSDIYIGDVSSQAIEFILYKERPMFFIDCKKIRNSSKLNILSWELGEIVENFQQLERKIKNPNEHFIKYKNKQKEFISDFFYTDSEFSASELAANAISGFLSK